MNDVQAKTNKKNAMKTQYLISEDQDKDLQIHQLSNELNNAKEDLKRLINSTPDIESLYKKLNEANDKNQTLECTISSLKTRIKQFQAKNNEFQEQIQMNTKNNSIQISNIKMKIVQQQKELTDFFQNISQITGKEFSSYNDVIQYIKSDNLHVNNNNSEVEKLKEKNKKIKKLISIVKEEKCQIQSKLDQALMENDELNNIVDKDKSVIESFHKENQKLERKLNQPHFQLKN